MRTVSLALFAIALGGCGTIVVNDVTVMEDDYFRSHALVLSRAEGELGCPRNQLTTRVLDVTVHAQVRRFAVRGCAKDVVYRRTDEGFAIETAPPLRGR